MKICIAICLGCALVAVGECQDLTALMFQAMGIEAPMLPPTMPSSLREHLYPRQRQQQLLQQQRQQQQQHLQKQRYLAYLTSQQQRQTKNNPYTLSSGSYSGSSRTQPRSNSVYSSANRIRVPGAANSVGGSKGNPYGSSYQSAPSKGNSYGSSYQSTSNKGNPYGSSYQTSNKAAGSSRSANPYSNSRGPARGVPTLRNTASLNPVPIPAHATRLMRTMQTLKAVGEQPRRMHDAQSAGCASPGEGIAGVLMYGDCRNPASQMACQAEMMSCVNVGMSSMCCPLGMNGLALDAIGYMNKMQQFVEGFA